MTESATEPGLSIPVETTAPGDDGGATPDARRFTAEDIARARQEEKDKLYGRIAKQEDLLKVMKAEVEALRRAKEEELAAQEESRRKSEQDARRAAEEEMSAKDLLAQRQTEWESRFAALQAERETERAVFAREQEFIRLREHARRRVDEALANNEIAPELADFVAGNSEQEIDASLDFVKAKSEAILQSVMSAQQAARANMRGVAPTGYSTSGPMDTEPGHKTFTVDELKNMPISEYAKNRTSLLGAAATAHRERGLYG